MTTARAGGRHGKPWRAAGAALVLLAMAGAGMIGASVRSAPPPRPPQPLAQAGPAESDRTAGVTVEGTGVAIADQVPIDEESADPSAPGAVPALPRSAPTTISIPRIGVNADVMTLGIDPDGTVQVPPLEQAQRAGWYSPGPSPGEVGNAVIVGHVDSAKLGPAVFFDLGALKPGDRITVARQDGRNATFTVDSVKSYPKTSFPSELVYGASDKPSLRVVTCGGVFDRSARSYLDNIVVFATLTA
ncbi:class F sortase [Micromonospora globispora]|uniref:class F sortase n=1 Tax=Micromonospora globispora TaxID=1450148 RepID=UPI000D6F6F7F|nr:class F sortase [Micromonospora globispora]PWU61024.1 class F sortase [Micromonospora globispora]